MDTKAYRSKEDNIKFSDKEFAYCGKLAPIYGFTYAIEKQL